MERAVVAFFLVSMAAIQTAMCLVTYNRSFHDRWWYLPLGTAMGCAYNLIWFLAARFLGEDAKIYVFSLLWDLIIFFVYFFVPLAFLGVRLSVPGLIGVGLMAVGFCVVKACEGR